MADQSEKTIRPVKEINARIRATIERELRDKYVTVIGTIRRPPTTSELGHIYFEISEQDYSIPCFVRQVTAGALGFKITAGMKIQVSGAVGVYDRDLEVRIEVDQMTIIERPDTRSLDELENHLKEKGVWHNTKRPLPAQINRIGLVTSRNSKALDDFQTTYTDQQGKAHVWHERIPLEGDDAPQKIVEAIQSLNRRPDVDVIVLARGGGRREELAVFNNPAIAEAIFHSQKPVITGIGHEGDQTLADRAADIKAITPTAAAVLLAQHRPTPQATPEKFPLWAGILIGAILLAALAVAIIFITQG